MAMTANRLTLRTVAIGRVKREPKSSLGAPSRPPSHFSAERQIFAGLKAKLDALAGERQTRIRAMANLSRILMSPPGKRILFLVLQSNPLCNLFVRATSASIGSNCN